jgi:hypothetical protein
MLFAYMAMLMPMDTSWNNYNEALIERKGEDE